MQIIVGIITVSDRASRGEYDDLGGPALKEFAEKNHWNVLAEAVVPDELEKLQAVIRSFAAQGCGLILTTGGTGIA
ncbi:MAG: MogA/MoaB family molybdenum cofactor biosynthesis protein, partial [Chthoniobacterales bacterium]